jgi:hypothetical protein
MKRSMVRMTRRHWVHLIPTILDNRNDDKNECDSYQVLINPIHFQQTVCKKSHSYSQLLIGWGGPRFGFAL